MTRRQYSRHDPASWPQWLVDVLAIVALVLAAAVCFARAYDVLVSDIGGHP